MPTEDPDSWAANDLCCPPGWCCVFAVYQGLDKDSFWRSCMTNKMHGVVWVTGRADMEVCRCGLCKTIGATAGICHLRLSCKWQADRNPQSLRQKNSLCIVQTFLKTDFSAQVQATSENEKNKK
jgi:hypothetical protein